MKSILLILILVGAAWFIYDWQQSEGQPTWRPSGTVPSIPALSPSPSLPEQQEADAEARPPAERVVAQARATSTQLTSPLQTGSPRTANQASSFNREWTANQSALSAQQVDAARRLNRIFTEMEAERARREHSLRDIQERPYQSFRADGAQRTREFLIEDMERQWNVYVSDKQRQINRLLQQLNAGR